MGDDIAYPQIPEEKTPAPNQLSAFQKAEFLRSVEAFSHVAVEELFQLAALAREVEFPAGTAIFVEGCTPDALLLVVRGKVGLKSGGRAVPAAGPREALALNSVLTHEPTKCAATALEDTLALSIPAEDFFHLISNNLEILAGLFKYFTRRLPEGPTH